MELIKYTELLKALKNPGVFKINKIQNAIVKTSKLATRGTMIYHIIFLVFTVISTDLFGGIENHFKKITNKTAGHSIRNIDFIYAINLDKRPEKFAMCLKSLQPYGITPFRFSAVNGWELTLQAINELGVKFQPGHMPNDLMGTCYLPESDGRTPHHEILQVPNRNYFSHCMSRGAIGIVLSHLSILQDAYDSGYKTIWIMEDDIQVIRDPHILSTLIDKLDAKVGRKNWDILFTDQDTKNQQGQYVPCKGYARRPNFTPEKTNRFSKRKQISAGFRKIGARYGAYSMIVRRSGMKKILNFIKAHHIFLPYDMDFYLPNDIKMYTVTNDVISTIPNALSDNGAPNYKNKLLVN